MLASIEATSPVADIIDSKERVFCQCGSRALQQETRQRPSQPGFSQRRDQVLITADNAETLGGVATRPADSDSTREIGSAVPSWNLPSSPEIISYDDPTRPI